MATKKSSWLSFFAKCSQVARARLDVVGCCVDRKVQMNGMKMYTSKSRKKKGAIRKRISATKAVLVLAFLI